ncbi:MAG: hypothetical protein ABII00_11495 [Elusimicrobiota bacterium]
MTARPRSLPLAVLLSVLFGEFARCQDALAADAFPEGGRHGAPAGVDAAPAGAAAADRLSDSELAAPAAVRPGDAKLSKRMRDALSSIARELSATESGRRLLALTGETPVVERARQPGAAVRYCRDENLFVVDPGRSAGLTRLDFEALFVRERWKAAARLPIDLIDAEMAARQAVLEYALQKAAVRPDFARRLRMATVRERERLEERRKMDDWAKRGGKGDPLLFPGPPPKGTLSRIAFDLYLFSEDPYVFYAAAVESPGPPPGAVTFSEVGDFLELHAPRLDRIQFRAGGRYALVEGRPYPGRVARAARVVRDREGLSRLTEGLGLFRTVAQRELSKEVNAWLRAIP